MSPRNKFILIVALLFISFFATFILVVLFANFIPGAVLVPIVLFVIWVPVAVHLMGRIKCLACGAALQGSDTGRGFHISKCRKCGQDLGVAKLAGE
jgi:hypothetical protein